VPTSLASQKALRFHHYRQFAKSLSCEALWLTTLLLSVCENRHPTAAPKFEHACRVCNVTVQSTGFLLTRQIVFSQC
jgi:hypothetical protein